MSSARGASCWCACTGRSRYRARVIGRLGAACRATASEASQTHLVCCRVIMRTHPVMAVSHDAQAEAEHTVCCEPPPAPNHAREKSKTEAIMTPLPVDVTTTQTLFQTRRPSSPFRRR